MCSTSLYGALIIFKQILLFNYLTTATISEMHCLLNYIVD